MTANQPQPPAESAALAGSQEVLLGLVGRLKEWTGERWLIAAQGGGGAESLWEKQKREEREERAQIERDPFIVAVMQAFPGTEIVGVRNLAQPEPQGPPAEDEPENDED